MKPLPRNGVYEPEPLGTPWYVWAGDIVAGLAGIVLVAWLMFCVVVLKP